MNGNLENLILKFKDSVIKICRFLLLIKFKCIVVILYKICYIMYITLGGFMKVVSVKKVGVKTVRNLTVSKNHTFITENGIVTHN